MQTLDDESWAIDNLAITVGDTPRADRDDGDAPDGGATDGGATDGGLE